jgi:hypothetical protein
LTLLYGGIAGFKLARHSKESFGIFLMVARSASIAVIALSIDLKTTISLYIVS